MVGGNGVERFVSIGGVYQKKKGRTPGGGGVLFLKNGFGACLIVARYQHHAEPNQSVDPIGGGGWVVRLYQAVCYRALVSPILVISSIRQFITNEV